MKPLVVVLYGALSGLLLPQAVTQPDRNGATSQTQLRETEVRQLSPLYGIDMARGTWTSQPLSICPILSHREFSRFDRTDNGAVTASFIASYPLGVMSASPAKKPWQSGIVLLRLSAAAASQPRTVMDLANTITAYNHLWTEELARVGPANALRTTTWESLASCFIDLANEQQDPPVTPETLSQSTSTLASQSVSGILIPLAGTPGKTRTIQVSFDPRGFVTDSTVSVN